MENTRFGDDIKYASLATCIETAARQLKQANKSSPLKVKYSVYHRMICGSSNSRFTQVLTVNILQQQKDQYMKYNIVDLDER